MPKLSGMNIVSTFHISLPFKNDEGITPTATILVTNNSYTFDRPETFEFTSEIALGRVFWLMKIRFLEKGSEGGGTWQTRRAMNRVLYGSPTASWSSEGLSKQRGES